MVSSTKGCPGVHTGVHGLLLPPARAPALQGCVVCLAKDTAWFSSAEPRIDRIHMCHSQAGCKKATCQKPRIAYYGIRPNITGAFTNASPPSPLPFLFIPNRCGGRIEAPTGPRGKAVTDAVPKRIPFGSNRRRGSLPCRFCACTCTACAPSPMESMTL